MEKKFKRPVLIWIAYILVLLVFVLNVPLSIIGESIYGPLYPFFLLFVSVVNLFSFVGVFMMKRWGVNLYIWMFVVAQVIMLIKNWWAPFNFVIAFVLIVILAVYYKRMN